MHYVKMAIGALVIGTALTLAGCPTMDGSMKSDSGSMGSGDSMKSKSGWGTGAGTRSTGSQVDTSMPRASPSTSSWGDRVARPVPARAVGARLARHEKAMTRRLESLKGISGEQEVFSLQAAS